MIPLGQVALTARINNSRSKTLPIVWGSEVPIRADTDFIYLFLNQKKNEINERYPRFSFTNLAAIGQQFNAYAFCAVEQRLPHPFMRDTLPYIRMSSQQTNLRSKLAVPAESSLYLSGNILPSTKLAGVLSQSWMIRGILTSGCRSLLIQPLVVLSAFGLPTSMSTPTFEIRT